MSSSTEGKSPRHVAMDLLSRREHSRRELVLKLGARGFTEEECRNAVEQLAAEGLQSDRRFTESFVNSRVGRGNGPVRIRHELDQRGISSDMVERCLAETGTDWQDLARSVRRRKFGSDLPVEYKEKARQARFLQQRGFTAGQSMGAMVEGAD